MCSLLKTHSRSACSLGRTYGCYESEQLMWVTGGCRGRFRCTGFEASFLCGRMDWNPKEMHNCSCSADVRSSLKRNAAEAATARTARLWDTPSHRECIRSSHHNKCPYRFEPGVCAGRNTNLTGTHRVVRRELLSALYRGRDPFHGLHPMHHKPDHSYPHSNLRASFVRAVLLSISHTPVTFWLEAGSFVGNSATATAAVAAHLCFDQLSLIAVDPFTGDAGMWMYPKNLFGHYDFLRLSELGRATIHERFLANVLAAGVSPMVLPIVLPAVTGMRLLQRLLHARALSSRPQIIYLDSAHEEGETMLELNTAWELLLPGGILCGDDWGWSGVRHDVLAFSASVNARSSGYVASTTKARSLAFLQHTMDGGLNCSHAEADDAGQRSFLVLCMPSATWALFK